MNTSTSTNIGAKLIIAAFGTAVISPIHYSIDSSNIPAGIIKYQSLSTNSWDDYQIFNVKKIDPKINSLHDFSQNLLKNTSDIDPEILEVLNENFWDLI
jgi:hypothetical protein